MHRFVVGLIFMLSVTACSPKGSHASSGGSYKVEDSVSYDPADPVRVATIYRPLEASAVPLPWIYAIHGGGFMLGSRHDCSVYASDYCPEGYAVVSVDYHLSVHPGGTWPAPLRDCQTGLRYFREHAFEYGLDPNRFVVMGGSAGGCLSTRLGLEDDPQGPLGRADHVVDISGEQDFRLLDKGMTNHDQITENLLGHPGPWTEDELLGPTNIHRVRPDVDIFMVHGTANGDVYVINSDRMNDELVKMGARVEYHRVEGAGMWATGAPEVRAALFSWLAARLRA